ncbi:MAG TPA: TOBE-like domain-containing protein [Propionibacteriaceae bacterium]|nr:TOBE-like domain-containing protein [Propionibacteriaceae bacterium]
MSTAPRPAPAVSVRARVAARDCDLRLDVAPGHTMAVIGPNGAGKSTLLGLVSGELRPDEGEIRAGGRALADASTFLTAPHRRVGYLAQRGLLLPHLDVLDNVAFGPRARGTGRRQARERALAELREVDADDLAHRRPRELSGGQAQRVALARALATDPDIVLLDEPMAALDVASAAAMRTLLARRLRGRTTLLVSHDPLDLWTLAEDVAVVEHGRVVASGPRDEVLGAPPTPFAAELAGVNRIEGIVLDTGLLRAGEHEIVGVDDEVEPPRPGHRALALFEPAAVSIHRDRPGGSPRNVWPAEVSRLQPHGPLVRVRLRLADGQHLGADVTPRAVAALGLAEGQPVFAVVKAAQVRLVAEPEPAVPGAG